MSNASKKEHAKISILLKKVKECSSNNDMLGASLEVGKLRQVYNLNPEAIKNLLKKRQKCEVSLPHIYNHIKLSKVPAKVQAYIRAKKINATDVLGLIHKHQTEKELIASVEDKIQQLEIEAANKKAEKEKAEKIKMKSDLEERVTKLVNERTDKKVPRKTIMEIVKQIEGSIPSPSLA